MRRTVARLGAALIVIAGVSGVRPAPADTPCVATLPASAAADSVCTYTATKDAFYVAAVNGTWSITKKHGLVTTTENGDGPRYGAIQSVAGDVITLRILTGNGSLLAEENDN